MTHQVSNHALAALLQQAGFEARHGAFARQVNHELPGASRYDAASVYWWLRGRRPDEPVRKAIAAVLTRRIGRMVTPIHLGFDLGGAVAIAYPPTVVEAVDAAAGLWQLASARPDVLAAAAFIPEALLQAGMAWRYDPADTDRSRTTGCTRVTFADVEALTLYSTRYIDLDRRHGGGSGATRTLLADFLNRQVSPMLRATYTDEVGKALLNAAAELAGQLGYMAWDAGEHGASQRHLTTALRLSKAADDPLYGAHVLANMATQAIYLGHIRDALRLALAAVDRAARAPASVRARLYTTQACAHAIAGDRPACLRALRRAHAAVEASNPGDGPRWAGYFSPAHFAGTAARCFRDLKLPAKALLHGPAALALPVDSGRTQALHHALLATVHTDARNLDQAVDHGDQALAYAATVNSLRVRSRIAELADRLRPHRDEPVVTAFFERHHADLALV